MQYVSIDIETTGLNPDTCQIIEFAAILADSEDFHTPIDRCSGLQTSEAGLANIALRGLTMRVLRAFGDCGTHRGIDGVALAVTLAQGLHCEEEPPAQEVTLGASEHRPLQHLQAINLALDRAV